MHISAVMCILEFVLKNIKKLKKYFFYFLHWQIVGGNQPIFLAVNVLKYHVHKYLDKQNTQKHNPIPWELSQQFL